MILDTCMFKFGQRIGDLVAFLHYHFRPATMNLIYIIEQFDVLFFFFQAEDGIRDRDG